MNVETKDFHQNLKSVENWVDKNKMSLALDKCFKVEFRGNQHEFILCETAVESSNVIKDLGIHVSKHLTWTTHNDSRMSKANKTFYCIRRNLEFNVKMRIKLGLYKSLILPVLTYGLIICNISRSDLGRLERFQQKVLKWITGKDSDYKEQLRLLNILPLALFLQLNELLMMAKFMHEENNHIKLPAKIENPGRTKEIFNLNKTRIEKARGEFTFRTCRLINRLNQKIEFREMSTSYSCGAPATVVCGKTKKLTDAQQKVALYHKITSPGRTTQHEQKQEEALKILLWNTQGAVEFTATATQSPSTPQTMT